MEGSLRFILALLIPDAEERPDPRYFPWERLRAPDARALSAVIQHLVDVRSKDVAGKPPPAVARHPQADRLLQAAEHARTYQIGGSEGEPPKRRKRPGISASTAKKAIVAYRGVLKEALNLELMSAEEHARASNIQRVKQPRSTAKSRRTSAADYDEKARTGRALDEEEFVKLIEECLHPTMDPSGAPFDPDDNRAGVTTEKGLRDAVLLTLGYGCGLRRDELGGLYVADFDLYPARGRQPAVVVTGKGDKTRRVPLPAGVLKALHRYLDMRWSIIEDAYSNNGRVEASLSPGAVPFREHLMGPLFLRSRRGGRLVRPSPMAKLTPLTGQAVYEILKTRAGRVLDEAFAPHDLRRTYITHLLEEDHGIHKVQRLAGHASIETTRRYDHSGERERDAVIRKHHVPFPE